MEAAMEENGVHQFAQANPPPSPQVEEQEEDDDDIIEDISHVWNRHVVVRIDEEVERYVNVRYVDLCASEDESVDQGLHEDEVIVVDHDPPAENDDVIVVEDDPPVEDDDVVEDDAFDEDDALDAYDVPIEDDPPVEDNVVVDDAVAVDDSSSVATPDNPKSEESVIGNGKSVDVCDDSALTVTKNNNETELVSDAVTGPVTPESETSSDEPCSPPIICSSSSEGEEKEEEGPPPNKNQYTLKTPEVRLDKLSDKVHKIDSVKLNENDDIQWPVGITSDKEDISSVSSYNSDDNRNEDEISTEPPSSVAEDNERSEPIIYPHMMPQKPPEMRCLNILGKNIVNVYVRTQRISNADLADYARYFYHMGRYEPDKGHQYAFSSAVKQKMQSLPKFPISSMPQWHPQLRCDQLPKSSFTKASPVPRRSSLAPGKKRMKRGLPKNGVNNGMEKCPFCEKTFRYKQSLATHKRMHTGEKPYACPFCDGTFNQKFHMIRHIARHHPYSPDQPKKVINKSRSCAFCGEEHRGELTNLLRHLRDRHQDRFKKSSQA